MDLLLRLFLLCLLTMATSSSSADEVLIEHVSPSIPFTLSNTSSFTQPMELAFLNSISTTSVCSFTYLSLSLSLHVNIRFGDRIIARLFNVIFDSSECAATLDTNWQRYCNNRRFVSGKSKHVISIDMTCSFGVFSCKHFMNVPCNDDVITDSGNSRKNCLIMPAMSCGCAMSVMQEPPLSTWCCRCDEGKYYFLHFEQKISKVCSFRSHVICWMHCCELT